MTDRDTTNDPHYQRIRRELETNIQNGRWTPGNRIPGEREIARQAGVSQMTVNRALQELVRSGWLVRRVGSGTFVRDRALERMLVKTLVFVAPFTAHPEEDVYLRTPFDAIRQGAAAEGYSLVIAEVPEGGYNQVVERHPNAAFLFAAPFEEHYGALRDLQQRGVPFVVMGASWPGAPFVCIDSDNAAGARLAVEYLIRLGHTRIAFVNGVENAANCRDRLEGYRQALREHAIDTDDALVVTAESNWELGGKAHRDLTGLLLRSEPVTAILCAGYSITLGVYTLLQTLSLTVPADVSVIGFDDPRSAEHLNPPLTTVRQPLAALGEQSVRRVLEMHGATRMETPNIEYQAVDLIVRESCRRRS